MGQRPRDGTTLCRQANRRACPGDGHEVSRRPAQRDRGDHCYYSDRLLGNVFVEMEENSMQHVVLVVLSLGGLAVASGYAQPAEIIERALAASVSET